MDKKTLERMLQEQDKDLEEFLKQRNFKNKSRRKSAIGSLRAMVGDLKIGRRSSTVKRDM